MGLGRIDSCKITSTRLNSERLKDIQKQKKLIHKKEKKQEQAYQRN